MPLAETRISFAAQLRSRLQLSLDDAQAIASLITRVELIRSRTDIVRQGERTEWSILLLDGYACRYKVGSHGQRQIISFHFPGEILEVYASVRATADHGLAALTRCRIAKIRHSAIPDLFAERPAIARAFWADALADAAIALEWVMTIGRRDGPARVAHLFCELATRMKAIGRYHDGRFEFPVTQVDLADATGMTPIHMNRILHRLRADGILSLNRHSVTIHDWTRLSSIGDFDPSYLGIDINPRRIDRHRSAAE